MGWGFADPSTPAAGAHFHSVPQEAHALDGSHRPRPTTKALSRVCTGQASFFHSTFASRPQVTIFTRSGGMGCPFVILPQPVCGRAAPRVGRELSPAAGSALGFPPYPTRSHCTRPAPQPAGLISALTGSRWFHPAAWQTPQPPLALGRLRLKRGFHVEVHLRQLGEACDLTNRDALVLIVPTGNRTEHD